MFAHWPSPAPPTAHLPTRPALPHTSPFDWPPFFDMLEMRVPVSSRPAAELCAMSGDVPLALQEFV